MAPESGAPLEGVLHDPEGPSIRVTLSWLAARRALFIENARAPAAGREPLRLQVAEERLSVAGGGWRGDAVHLQFDQDGRPLALTVAGSAALARLAAMLPERLGGEVRRLQAGQRRFGLPRRAAWALLVLLLLVAAAPLLLLLWLLIDPAPLAGAVAARVPVAVDRTLGEIAEREIAAASRRIEGPPARAVEAIGRRLLSAAPRHPFAFRFAVIDETTANAFAAPGGLVVLHAGLLRAAGSADEVAGVLAHEIQHVLLRHTTRQLLRDAGVSVLLGVLFGSTDALAGLLGAGGELAALGYSREQEREADAAGLDLLRAAGLEPEGLIAFLERTAAAGVPPVLLSTHPGGAERAAELRALLARLPPAPLLPLDVDWDAVRRALGD